MPPSLTTHTYRVTDARACAVALPMGRLIRHLVVDSQFQGRADGENPEWVQRMDDTGMIRGYVKASLTEQMPTSFGIPSNRRETPAPTPSHYDTSAHTYRVTSPKGQEQTVTNLARFCRAHDLSRDGMYAVVVGRQKTHKGWRVRRVV